MKHDVAKMALTVDAYRTSLPEGHKPSEISITTITMFARNIIEPVSIKRIVETVGENRVIYGSIKRMWSLKPPKKTCNFYNSVSIGFTDRTSKSVKFFPNGSMQLTGATDPCQGMSLFQQAIKGMRTVMKIEKTPVDYSKIRIAMINTNFSIGFMLDLDAVTEVLREEGLQACFTPDTYSAVTVRYHPVAGRKRVTVNIFNSGSVIVTGAESLYEITAAYVQINHIMRAHFDVVHNPNCVVRARPRRRFRYDDVIAAAKEDGVEGWDPESLIAEPSADGDAGGPDDGVADAAAHARPEARRECHDGIVA